MDFQVYIIKVSVFFVLVFKTKPQYPYHKLAHKPLATALGD